MPEFYDRKTGETISLGSNKVGKKNSGKRSDSDKAAMRARSELRKHQASQHPGKKNEVGQRTVDKSQTPNCAKCVSLQAAVDGIRR